MKWRSKKHITDRINVEQNGPVWQRPFRSQGGHIVPYKPAHVIAFRFSPGKPLRKLSLSLSLSRYWWTQSYRKVVVTGNFFETANRDRDYRFEFKFKSQQQVIGQVFVGKILRAIYIWVYIFEWYYNFHPFDYLYILSVWNYVLLNNFLIDQSFSFVIFFRV